MKIVFLETKSIGKDLDLKSFEKLGEVVCYEETRREQIRERTADADIVVINKAQMNSETLKDACRLKLICVTATGTDNLDKRYLEQRKILWKNVAGYSTESVAQHTFALLFFLLEKLHYYNEYVKSGKYIEETIFTHLGQPTFELREKTWGIIGMGAIGQRVAQLAEAFGCRVIYYSTSGKNQQKDYTSVSLDTLLRESDVISVHAPLTENTKNLMNRQAFAKMKKTALFINVGRGPIVEEEALAQALEQDEIGGAGLDVLSTEPMAADCPLFRIKDSSKLIITPHIAWATREARGRLMERVWKQIRDFLEEK